MPGYSAHLKAAHQPPKYVFSTYYVPGHLLPQQWRRHRLYLGGAEAAAVAVVPRADGKHTSEPLLPPLTGLPGPQFLLGLQTPTDWLIQGRFRSDAPDSTQSPPRYHPPRQVPGIGLQAKPELCLLLQAWDPGCPQGHSVELTIRGHTATGLVSGVSVLLENTCGSLLVMQILHTVCIICLHISHREYCGGTQAD